MWTLGETLRQARLDKGVSLSDAARETRIRRGYLAQHSTRRNHEKSRNGAEARCIRFHRCLLWFTIFYNCYRKNSSLYFQRVQAVN